MRLCDQEAPIVGLSELTCGACCLIIREPSVSTRKSSVHAYVVVSSTSRYQAKLEVWMMAGKYAGQLLRHDTVLALLILRRVTDLLREAVYTGRHQSVRI